MWYSEAIYPNIKLQLKGTPLYSKKTFYQNLKVYTTDLFGKTLMLDGAIQTTEGDEFIYHEMLTHPVLLLHPKPQKVLIIGGGDGGILREVFKYKSVKHAYLVEIDKDIIDVSKKYLKNICRDSFQDKRTKIILDDGAKFIKRTKEKFDIIIIDSPDPVGPAKILFSKGFYKNVFSTLEADGLMIRQTGSTILQKEVLKNSWKALNEVFPLVWTHLVAIPTYIGGFFSLTAASKKVNLFKTTISSLEKKVETLKIKTDYYNPYIHIASAVLPEYVRRMLK